MCGREPEGSSLQCRGIRHESEFERNFEFLVFFEGDDGVGQAHAGEYFFGVPIDVVRDSGSKDSVGPGFEFRENRRVPLGLSGCSLIGGKGWGIAGVTMDIQKINIASAMIGRRFDQRK